MNFNNILPLLVGLSACYYFISKIDETNNIENFGMIPPRNVRVDSVAVNPSSGVSQSLPASANIRRVNPPSRASSAHISYMQSPSSNVSQNINQQPRRQASIQLANMVEGYSSDKGCRTDSSGNVSSNISSRHQTPYEETTDVLPVQSMGSVPDNALNAFGEQVTQPIIYDRYIYANQKSRLFAAGDPIRGDLPIVPECNSWFRPSAQPQIDLRDGALTSVAGPNNETVQELAALRAASSGGVLTAQTGNNVRVTNNPYTVPGLVQKSSQLGSDGSVRVSAFP